jgi:peptidoglycan/LPS O-acetylase OafA/YrhL
MALFLFNRFLRLFPAYWILLLASLSLFFLVGEPNSINYRSSMYFPDSLSLWLQNFSMIYCSFSPSEVVLRISPPTWALTIELIFYFLIAFGISKNAYITVFWVLLSVVYVACTFLLGLSYEYRYSAIFLALCHSS